LPDFVCVIVNGEEVALFEAERQFSVFSSRIKVCSGPDKKFGVPFLEDGVLSHEKGVRD